MAQKPKPQAPASRNRSEDTVEVGIIESREEWSEFKLSDGTKLRMKPVVVEIRRYKGKYTELGDPVYQVKSALVFDTRASTRLRRKTKTK